MKTVVLYHPPLLDNPNDQLIVDGVIELLTPYKIKLRHALFGQDLPTADAVIVCGTPWIFDQCGSSFKLNELRRVVENFSGFKIAVGIGSSFPSGVNARNLIEGPDVSVWCHFDHLAVRDRIARDLLVRYGIKADCLACPAMLAPRPQYKPDRNRTLLVHAAGAPIPEKVSFDTVVGLTQADADDAYRRGLTQVWLVSELETLKYEVLTCSELTSARVHTCIYAHGHVAKITPIAVDTRMAAYSELGDFETEKQRLTEWFHETFDSHLG